MAKASFLDDQRKLLMVQPAYRKETLDDIDLELVIRHYKKRGALLLRGFKPGLDGFKSLTEALCSTSVYNSSSGRQTIDATRNIQTVNLGQAAFSLHPEMSREPWRPDICFFSCINAPSRGGETTICDGVDIVAKMDDDTRAQFEGRGLRYRQPASVEECRYWYGCEEIDEQTFQQQPAQAPFTFDYHEGQAYRSFIVPALYRPLFSEQLAFGNMLFFARYMRGVKDFPTFEDDSLVSDELVSRVQAISEPLTLAVKWQPNDVLLLDNSRYMHGRNAIIDPAERLIASYFGFLRFAPAPEKGVMAPWREQSWGGVLPLQYGL